MYVPVYRFSIFKTIIKKLPNDWGGPIDNLGGDPRPRFTAKRIIFTRVVLDYVKRFVLLRPRMTEYLFLRTLASRDRYIGNLFGLRKRKKHEIRNNRFQIFGVRAVRYIL